jgi:AcrR family transcriptional regulator
MPKPPKPHPPARLPLTRERVLAAAMTLADAGGIDALSMRKLAQQLGVEAMSLYKHVANKDDLLDGLVDQIFAQMTPPSPHDDWRVGLRARADSVRQALLRHRWAAPLIESRVSPGPARLRHHDRVLGALRGAGFSVALAYSAFLTIDSYIYGFVLQEVWWPFSHDERPEVIDALRPAISPTEYPHLVEVMNLVMAQTSPPDRDLTAVASSYDADFSFGLDLILDGLARALGAD